MQMQRLHGLSGGRLHVRAADASLAEAASSLVEPFLDSGERCGELLAFGGGRAYLKAGPLTGKARWRHGARRHVLRRRLPRLQEYANLRWLRERIFQAPDPLAGGVLWGGGLPRYQFLLTAEVDGAADYEERFPDAPAELRRGWISELAREVGRMHALRFVHRDLFPRNLLVLPSDRPRRIVFLDAWAGGPGAGRRGPAYDLACLFLDGAEQWTVDEQRLFLRTYVAARAIEDRVPGAGFAAKVQRERKSLLRRLARDPARLRGRPMPGEWSYPST